MTDPMALSEEELGERLDRITVSIQEIRQMYRNQHLAWVAIARFDQMSPKQQRQGVEAFKAEMASLGFDA